jgi:hypothetical protein
MMTFPGLPAIERSVGSQYDGAQVSLSDIGASSKAPAYDSTTVRTLFLDFEDERLGNGIASPLVLKVAGHEPYARE